MILLSAILFFKVVPMEEWEDSLDLVMEEAMGVEQWKIQATVNEQLDHMEVCNSHID